MMPKSAVAERATITRLCARLPRRRLISISILRDHGGLRRHDNAIPGCVAHYRDPGLEEERDLDGHLATAGVADAGAVPDVAGVRLRRCGRAAARHRLPRAPISGQGKAAAELALDG